MPTHYPGSPEEVLALTTFIKLTRAHNAVIARIGHHGTMGELTTSQFGVLEAIHHLGPMSQREIGAKLLKSGGNMTMVIDNLVKRGLVERTRGAEDRRVMVVSLTPAGESLISAIFPRHAAAVTDEMSVLTADEQRELSRLCQKLGTARPAATPDEEFAETEAA